MDLHIGQGLTAEDMALAHQMDVRIQKDYYCKCLTYWFDKERGNAFCLIEAPSKEHVFELHKNSHKSIPNEIIEVDKRVIKILLGRIEDPRIVEYQIDQKIKVFTDPAYRVILTIENKDLIQLSHTIGPDKAQELLSRLNFIVKNCADKNNGSISEISNGNYSISFNSILSAPICAIDIYNFIQSDLDTIDLKIAIHSGNPVDRSKMLFGEILNFNNFICQIPFKRRITISNTVFELLKKNSDTSFDSGIIYYLKAEAEKFLKNLAQVLEENWLNPSFGVEEYAKALAMSQSQLYRTSVKVTGLSTNKLINNYRLHKAKNMLKDNIMNICEVASSSCFNSASYFSKCFYEKFGFLPSNYSKKAELT